jgi:ATP-binding cassette subfamily F protein uup
MSSTIKPILLGCRDLSKAYGVEPLFKGLSFSIHEGDHIGLIGPNGAGKSTLLRILAGQETADDGTSVPRRNLRVGYMPQHPEFPSGASVETVVREALETDSEVDEHDLDQRVAVALSRTGFNDPGADPETLSGGWRARLALARAIAPEPDLLLLDEPTNHLDIESILWLESFLKGQKAAFIVVSHDRYFLQNVAQRMLDIDRMYPEGLLAVEGPYADMLEARDALLSQQANYRESLSNHVRREVAWLRRGAKARTSKSKSRIDAAQRSIEELEQSRRRAVSTAVRVDLASSGRKTKRLWSARDVSRSYGETTIIRDLDLLLTPGARLGVIGANGSGKTTLLRMIVGDLEPDTGTIEKADNLRVVYFDQDRRSLDTRLTLKRALAPEGDSVVYRDSSVHIVTWARRFGFSREQLDTQVEKLSGGERARIHLARLMLRPADLLVLDEPTNDLDIATLEVLEESLLEFQGALVLVIHDRHVIDRVTTEILALDGSGNVQRFADYRQWEASRRSADSKRSEKRSARQSKPSKPRARKRSYLEQREWEGMEENIQAAETALSEARSATEDPSIATDSVRLLERLAALENAPAVVDRLYARWAELEQ